MPVFIGGTYLVSGKKILAIIDFTYFEQGDNKKYLEHCMAEEMVADITEGSQPRSLVITEDRLYISPIAPLTLKKRTDRQYQGIEDLNFVEEY